MSVGVNQKYKKMKHVNYFAVLFYGNMEIAPPPSSGS